MRAVRQVWLKRPRAEIHRWIVDGARAAPFWGYPGALRSTTKACWYALMSSSVAVGGIWVSLLFLRFGL
ncbi:MAG: hypothetical protein AB1Z31_26760 [Desulfobacterales bacterium]